MNFKDIMLSEINQSQRHAVWFHSHEKWASLVAQMVKNPSAMWETLGSIPGFGRFPGGEHGNPLHYSCLENPHGQRILAGCSPWGCKESDTTQWLGTCVRVAQFIGTESERMVVRGVGEGGMGSGDCFHNSVKVLNATEPYIKNG